MGRSEAEHAAMRREEDFIYPRKVHGTGLGTVTRLSYFRRVCRPGLLLLSLVLAIGCGRAGDARPANRQPRPDSDPGVIEEYELPATMPPGESP